MRIDETYTLLPADGEKAITVDELAGWVRELSVVGVGGAVSLSAEVTMRGQLRKITARRTT